MSTFSIADKAMLVRCSFSMPGMEKRDLELTATVNTEHAGGNHAGVYVRKIWSASQIAPVTRACDQMRATFRHMTLPWSDSGFRILPTASYLRFAPAIDDCIVTCHAEADKFCELESYAVMVEERRTILGALFREDDYLTPEKLREQFNFSVEYMKVPIGDDFRAALDEKDLLAIREDIDAKHEQNARETSRYLFDLIYMRVERMVERLKKYSMEIGPNGNVVRKNAFRDSIITNIEELAAVLPEFNLTDDPELTRLTSDLKMKLTKHKAEDLRRATAIRRNVIRDAEGILKQIHDIQKADANAE